MVDGLTDREVRAMFDRARDADYGELARQARDLAGTLGEEPAAERRVEARAQLARLRARLAQVAAIDFFGAPGSQAAEGLLAALEDRLREDEPAEPAAPADDLGPLRGPDLGDAPGRPRRPHRLGVAGPPLRRPRGDLQVRAGERVRAPAPPGGRARGARGTGRHAGRTAATRTPRPERPRRPRARPRPPAPASPPPLTSPRPVPPPAPLHLPPPPSPRSPSPSPPVSAVSPPALPCLPPPSVPRHCPACSGAAPPSAPPSPPAGRARPRPAAARGGPARAALRASLGACRRGGAGGSAPCGGAAGGALAPGSRGGGAGRAPAAPPARRRGRGGGGRAADPEPGELRFDMFGGEFTHEGDRCTFEVLLARAGPDDPALRAIAELVHDLDLKDGRFGRPEAAGLGALVEGLCAATGDDAERLARGGAILDDLHAYFARRRP